MRKKVIVCLALLVCQQGVAQEGLPLYGLGKDECGEYLEHRRQGDWATEHAYLHWMYGFFTARNYYYSGRQMRNDVKNATALAYLDKFCRDHPLALVAQGVIELAEHYAGLRATPSE